jgi:hypothetical protein
VAKFRDALAAFRKDFEAHAKQASAEQKTHFKYRLTLEILDRWGAAGDCEKIWNVLAPKLNVPASLFIGQIIFARTNAEELATRLREWPELKAKVAVQEKRHVLSGTPRKGWKKLSCYMPHSMAPAPPTARKPPLRRARISSSN